MFQHLKPRYRVKEAASILGMSRATLYEELNAGRLRSHRVGRLRYISALAVDEYIAGLERSSSPFPKDVPNQRRSAAQGEAS